MATKQLETLSGPVESVNAKGTGIKVLGEWLNVSQYHPIVPMPSLGELVQVQLERSDRGAWINSLQAIGPAAATSSPSTRDREIRRMSALRSAAIFAGGKALTSEVKSTDVLRIAEAWLDWLGEGEEKD